MVNRLVFVFAICCFGQILLACSKPISMTSTNSNPPNIMMPRNGTIDTYQEFQSDFVASRRVSVWLPKQYQSLTARGQRFAVLYMHDGQMLFDASVTWNQQEWGVDETAQTLINEQQVTPFIVVGIDNGGEQLRYVEYMPQKPFEALPKTIQNQIYTRQEHDNKIQSDAYLRFIVEELKPFIDTQYATITTPENTFVAGASMGGLISWYAVAEYPDVFGGCLCLSTHFPGGYELEDFTVFNAFADYMAKHLPMKGEHRLWFAYGDQTLDQYYPPYHEALQKHFTQWDADPETVTIQFFAGDDHSESSWQKQLPLGLMHILSNQQNSN
ncbi:MAG: esterase [Alteromonadaceae bacterium]|nr:esterase [Alteromonadaceae bacterium]